MQPAMQQKIADHACSERLVGRGEACSAAPEVALSQLPDWQKGLAASGITKTSAPLVLSL